MHVWGNRASAFAARIIPADSLDSLDSPDSWSWLVLIVRSGEKKDIDYKKILLPLALYLSAKFGYGLVIKTFSEYVSPTMQLLPALALISIVLLPKAAPWKFIKREPKGTVVVALARIPNTVGMLIENAVISISLAS